MPDGVRQGVSGTLPVNCSSLGNPIVTLPEVNFRGPSTVHVIRIGRHRTSIRLDNEFWKALEEIATRENLSIHDLCALVNERRGRYGLTAAIRTFVLCYYRSQRTDHAAPIGSHAEPHPAYMDA